MNYLKLILFCCCRDEKEKECEGDTQETDSFSKFNSWTKDTYNSYLARFVIALTSCLTRH